MTLGANAALTGATVRFESGIAGGGKRLWVTGNAEFNGTVSGLGMLGVTGATLLNTGAVTTSGVQTYGGRVTLAQDVALTCTVGGRIALNGGAGRVRVATNGRMSAQFNSADGSGYILLPLAVKPPVVAPPQDTDPAAPLPDPTEPLPAPSGSFRITQFDLMNWSLGFRDETVERPDRVWVIRSLGINGRWDNLGEVIRSMSAPKRFLEL